MFVLVDLEWVHTKNNSCFPTQLAAARVNADWEKTDTFFSFIHPQGCVDFSWEHMAFTGGTESDFLRAKDATMVYRSFLHWLTKDDVLLFWHEEAKTLFLKQVAMRVSEKRIPPCISAQAYVYDFLNDSAADCRSGLYALAAVCNVETHEQWQHYAVNDVEVFCALMKNIAYPQAKFSDPPPKLFRPRVLSPAEAQMPFRYDFQTKTVHRKGCAKLADGQTETYGSETLTAALRKGFQPCACCKADFLRARRARTADIVARTQYTYVYAQNATVFHKYTCPAVLSAKQILGSRDYWRAAAGRTPCKLCNPTPQDTPKPIPTPQKLLQTRPKKEKKKCISAEDARALSRQKAAAEERSRRLQNTELTEAQRADIYTLTQPEFAFWVGQGYQNFHLRSCPKLHGLSNLKGFKTFQDAVFAGYTPCRHCKPTAKHDVTVSIPIYSRPRADETVQDLVALCQTAGYAHSFDGVWFCLETPVGKWKIKLNTHPIQLYHINLVMTPHKQDYHKQPRLFLSLADVFTYIERHDTVLQQRRDLVRCAK
ncbi:MAG: hypothetical protein ACI4LI_07220 [Candidatus Fimenecus sp.]